MEFASAKQAGKETAIWNVTLAPNTKANSAITIRNRCKEAHSFTVTPKDVPYFQLTGDPTTSVPGRSDKKVPVTFNSTGMRSGEYQGSVAVSCANCGEERGCTQENELLPIHFTITPGIDFPLPTPTPTPTPGDQNLSCRNSECKVKEIILNTGYNQIAGATYSPVQPDGYWELVNAPNPGLTLPTPAWVITANPAWQTLPSSNWISAYNNSTWSLNNPAPDKPYSFQRCFCTCDGIKSLDIDLKLLVDNVADVYLDNVLIGQQTNPGTASFNQPLTIHKKIDVTPGKHCLRIDVRNLSGVAMGLDVAGTITSPTPTGAALFLSAACCNPIGKIIGQKVNDKNCDGKNQNEPGLPGWTITATNVATGASVSTTTDANGFYYFNNLPPGVYTISEGNQLGWTQTIPGGPPGTYTVQLGAGQVVQKDFANCRRVEQLPGKISGRKIHDINCNGKDDIEPGLQGWVITATNTSSGATVSAVTDASGFYSFNNLPAGTYTISETLQSGWTQSIPGGSGNYTVPLASGQSIQRDFANCKKDAPGECATVVAGEAVCKTDGSGGYTYTFTVTNNSGHDVNQILLTPVDGSLTLKDQTLNITLQNGQSTTITVDIGNVKPDARHCFYVTLMTKDGPCCTIRVCPELPDCCAVAKGSFECDPRGEYRGTFTIVNTSPNVIKNIYLYPPAGVTMSQTYFAVTLAPGQSFTTPVITIKGAKPGRFCFRISMHTADMKDCCSIDVCIVLPECHIGSANVTANPSQASGWGRAPRHRRTV